MYNITKGYTLKKNAINKHIPCVGNRSYCEGYNSNYIPINHTAHISDYFTNASDPTHCSRADTGKRRN
jgi:hypothetical protein